MNRGLPVGKGPGVGRLQVTPHRERQRGGINTSLALLDGRTMSAYGILQTHQIHTEWQHSYIHGLSATLTLQLEDSFRVGLGTSGHSVRSVLQFCLLWLSNSFSCEEERGEKRGEGDSISIQYGTIRAKEAQSIRDQIRLVFPRYKSYRDAQYPVIAEDSLQYILRKEIQYSIWRKIHHTVGRQDVTSSYPCQGLLHTYHLLLDHHHQLDALFITHSDVTGYKTYVLTW